MPCSTMHPNGMVRGADCGSSIGGRGGTGVGSPGGIRMVVIIVQATESLVVIVLARTKKQGERIVSRLTRIKTKRSAELQDKIVG